MIKRLILLIACIISFFSVYVSFSVFKGMIDQTIVDIDLSKKMNSIEYNDIENLFSTFPNVSVTTIPLNSYKAFYYYNYKNYDKALSILEESRLHNPYIFFVEFLTAKIFQSQKELDSAIFYSKKAFYGWPKNVDHFILYTDLLAQKGDTTEILNAFGNIDSLFFDRSEYGSHFIKSLAKAKLNYIANYKDRTSVDISKIDGKWTKVIEYKDSTFVRYDDFKLEFQGPYYIADETKFLYTIESDSLFIKPIQNPDFILTKYQILFSPKYETLLLLYTNEKTSQQSFHSLKKLNK